MEYVGCECFRQAVGQTEPEIVSCAVQLNLPGRRVSGSPYLHVSDGLDAIHCQMEKGALAESLACLGYRPILRREWPLPNGKKLLRLDFGR